MSCGALRPDETITRDPSVVARGCAELRRQLTPMLDNIKAVFPLKKQMYMMDTFSGYLAEK